MSVTVPLGHQAIDDPLLRFAKTHPALAVAGFTTAVFVIKVLFAAHLNTSVALGIVSAIGPADLLALLIAYVMGILTVAYFGAGDVQRSCSTPRCSLESSRSSPRPSAAFCSSSC